VVSLNDLKELGVISDKVRVLPTNGAKFVTIEQVESMSDSELSGVTEPIIFDNADWVATLLRKPVGIAQRVYSCKDSVVGVYDKNRRAFFFQRVQNNELVTFKQVTLPSNSITKGGHIMAQEINLNDMNLDALTEGINVPTSPAGTSNAEVSASEKATLEIKQMIKEGNQKEIANLSAVHLFNQQHGRFYAFVSRTDKAIKVSKASVKRLDANGNPILKENTPQDVRDKYAAEGKGASAYFEKDKVLRFKESKPSAPVAVIIGTPEGGDIDLTRIDTEAVITPERDKTSKKLHVLPIEDSYIYISALYGGRIQEDKGVLGGKATWLNLKNSTSRKVDDQGVPQIKVRSSYTIDRKATGSRTTVMTDGNVIPLREYVTIPVSNIASEEQAAALNLNFEAALKNASLADFPANQAHIRQAADGTVTSDYFKTGGVDATLFSEIFKYDSKDKTVDTVTIPVREKTPTKKDPSKFTYKFQFKDWDTVKTRADVKQIMQNAGILPDELKAQVDKCTKRSSSRKSEKAKIDANDLLKITLNNGFGKLSMGKSNSIVDIQRTLAGLA